MNGFLFNQNETIRLIGKQSVIMATDPVNEQINDIIAAYADTEDNENCKYIFSLVKKGLMSTLIRNIYILGVIHGKQAERAKRKPLTNHRD